MVSDMLKCPQQQQIARFRLKSHALDPVARVAWVAFADEPPGAGFSEVGLRSEVPTFPFFLGA